MSNPAHGNGHMLHYLCSVQAAVNREIPASVASYGCSKCRAVAERLSIYLLAQEDASTSISAGHVLSQCDYECKKTAAEAFIPEGSTAIAIRTV
jgi:hypothetical protein